MLHCGIKIHIVIDAPNVNSSYINSLIDCSVILIS